MKKIKIIKYVSIILCLLLVLGFYSVKVEAKWKTNEVGTWWENEDGSYPRSQWKEIDNEWYYFDDRGYVVTGWKQIDGFWYYFEKDGKMAKGWRKINNQWYYLTMYGGNGHPKGSWIDDNSCERGTIKGIDVSEWQGNIDWKKVKEDGVQFAYIRLGGYNYYQDLKFKDNVKGATDNDIPIGVYYYCTSTNEDDARSKAQFVINRLQGIDISYPIAVDMEDSSLTSLSKEKITSIAKAFCDEIKAAGYTPMIYCNENWAKNYIDFSCLDNVERWIAAYGVSCSSSIERNIWQCCSMGRVDGISGDVDINFAYTQYSLDKKKYADSNYHVVDGYLHYEDNNIKYKLFNGGQVYNQWVYINRKWYWIDNEGNAAVGWKRIDDKWYWFNPKGEMTTGWQKVGYNWYFFNQYGAMETGWQKIGNNWYYLNPSSGEMKTGWQKIGNYWYYLNPSSGEMKTGWQKIGNTWYYLYNNGVMATGWQKIGYSWYYFLDGAMQTNQYIGNCYIDKYGVWTSTAKGWKRNIKGWWFELEGGDYLKDTWMRINGKWYYFDTNGYMLYDCYVDGYYLKPDGSMQ